MAIPATRGGPQGIRRPRRRDVPLGRPPCSGAGARRALARAGGGHAARAHAAPVGAARSVTRILVETQPGWQARVATELRALAAGRLDVAPAEEDVTLLHEALGPSRLASGLFAAIGALLGLLLAFNAMLLTVPERRQVIAALRLAGTRRAGIVEMVLFQALCLGIVASLAGLLAGYALSVGVFHQSSAYFAEAFTLGSSTVLSPEPVLLAFLGGIVATCLASAVPLLDLRRGRPRDAVYRHDGVAGDALAGDVQRRLFAAPAC